MAVLLKVFEHRCGRGPRLSRGRHRGWTRDGRRRFYEIRIVLEQSAFYQQGNQESEQYVGTHPWNCGEGECLVSGIADGHQIVSRYRSKYRYR